MQTSQNQKSSIFLLIECHTISLISWSLYMLAQNALIISLPLNIKIILKHPSAEKIES